MAGHRGSIVGAVVLSALLLMVLPPSAALAASPLWTALYNGPAGAESQRAQAVAVAPDGAIYVAGIATNTFGKADVVPWLVKYASDGTQAWAVCPSDVVKHGQFVGVTVMLDGDVLAWGATGRYGADLLLVRYRPDGTRRWVARIKSGVDAGSLPADVAVDAHGDIYVAGTIGNRTTYDGILAKLGPSGRLLWRRSIAGDPNQYDGLTAVAVGRRDNVYACGYITRHRNSRWLVLSYTSAGSRRWMRTGTSLVGGASDLTIAPSGVIYACGGSVDSRQFALLRAYRSDGKLLFGRRMYSGQAGLGAGFRFVKFDAEGHVVCAGDTNTRYAWGDYASDFLTAEYDAQGSLFFRDVWSGASGREDWVYGLECASDGSVLVCGESMGSESCSLVVIPYGSAGVRGEPMFSGTGSAFDEDSRASAMSAAGPVVVGSQEFATDGHIHALTVQFPSPTVGSPPQ